MSSGVELPEDVREMSQRLLDLAKTIDPLFRGSVLKARHILEREATAHQQYIKLVSQMAATREEGL